MKHKWHKEIKAWADGAEIEVWDMRWHKWVGVEDPTWEYEINEVKYRIKSQPKEPQYLYVSQGLNGSPAISFIDHQGCIGKIKLEVDDDLGKIL
jgi:hypothetical protein